MPSNRFLEGYEQKCNLGFTKVYEKNIHLMNTLPPEKLQETDSKGRTVEQLLRAAIDLAVSVIMRDRDAK